MKNNLKISLLLPVLIFLMCKAVDMDDPYVETILMDGEYLKSTKARIKKNDSQLMDAFDQLIEDAEVALKEGPFTVTDKEKLPPSGDKNDYASYSRYWWPDANQPDGLPYIRRDGVTNPQSQSLKESDRQRIGLLGENVETLGLAYYITGEEKYAKKAAGLLRVWFLDASTRMNPNVNHAQIRSGHNFGTKSGVLDGRLLIRALEGSILINNFLSDVENEGLKDWASQYFKWLTTSEIALEEAASNNNHGSFYDVQAMYFALYSGNREAAIEIAQDFAQSRILSQIKPDGSMPEEIARTRPLFYSIYNLHAMFIVAHLAKKVDIDVWKNGGKDSRLRIGLDNLVPYIDSNKVWPVPTIGKADRMELFALLQMAEDAYPEGNYLKMAERLPLERRKTLRTNLAYPLMR